MSECPGEQDLGRVAVDVVLDDLVAQHDETDDPDLDSAVGRDRWDAGDRKVAHLRWRVKAERHS